MNQSAQQTATTSTPSTAAGSSSGSKSTQGERVRESLRGQDFATQEQMLRPTETPAPTSTKNTDATAAAEKKETSPLQAALNAIPPYHVILEQLAHNYAYHSGDLSDVDDLKGKSDAKWLEQSRLKKIGYERKQVVESAATGFQVTLFMPVIEMRGKSADPASLGLPEDLRLRPVLAFRGTDGGPDVTDDANPMGIGSFQFAMHEEQIGALIAKANGSGQGAPDLTGHSLGGALAQRAAARFSGDIHDIITFQAPGIGADAAKVGKDHKSTHYMMAGDLVSTSGGAHTPGLTVTLSQVANNDPTSHGAFPLASINDQRTDDRTVDAIDPKSLPVGGMGLNTTAVKDSGAFERVSEGVRGLAGAQAMTPAVAFQAKLVALVKEANSYADQYSVQDDITPAMFSTVLQGALPQDEATKPHTAQVVRNATLRFERLQKERRG